MITQVAYFGVFVRDLEAAIRFYQDQLGFTLDEQASIPGQYAQFNFNNKCALALFYRDTDDASTSPYQFGLFVDDANATYADWKEKGVPLMDAPQDMPFGKAFAFETRHGYTLSIIQPLQ